MKNFVFILVLLAVGVAISPLDRVVQEGTSEFTPSVSAVVGATNASSWSSGSQVSGSGTVVRVLTDDNDGSRHQRFILELGGGRTVLIAHNIDLAPRIGSISIGDTVSFFGQYETNDRGGVIHWTHKDPQGRHVDGWLEHRGNRYQ